MQGLHLQRINLMAGSATRKYIRDALEAAGLSADAGNVHKVLTMVEQAYEQQLASEIDFMVEAIEEGN